MEETALIVLIAAGVLGLAALVWTRARRSRHEARLERERTARRVQGHREEAELHSGRVSDLEPRAEEHRRQAQEHVAKATELEQKADRSRELASAHEQRAAEARSELDDR